MDLYSVAFAFFSVEERDDFDVIKTGLLVDKVDGLWNSCEPLDVLFEETHIDVTVLPFLVFGNV